MSVRLPDVPIALPNYNKQQIIFVDIRPMYAMPAQWPPPSMPAPKHMGQSMLLF